MAEKAKPNIALQRTLARRSFTTPSLTFRAISNVSLHLNVTNGVIKPRPASGHDGNLFDLQTGRFQRLRITNESYRLHPMHLHGQFFKLLAVDGRPVRENFWRDTVLVGPKQSLDIGLVPVDKGSWAFHCHVLEHAEAGMMSTLGVK